MRHALAGPLIAAALLGSPAKAAPGTEPPVDAIRRVLEHHPDPLRRESAAILLGTSADLGAVSLLLQRLKEDGNRWVRAAIAEALGLLGDRSAAAPLRSALAREKHPRVRRALALALMRLGERAGVGELMWRLSSGNQHTKAETMKALVRATGQPLGQDVKAWWRYFGRPLQQEIGRPPGGLLELDGLRSAEGHDQLRMTGTTAPLRWHQACAHRVRLPVGADKRIGATTLATHQAKYGDLDDGCLLLLELQLPTQAPSRSAGTAPTTNSASERATSPGLTLQAAKFLTQLRPLPKGIALAAPDGDVARCAPDARRVLQDQGLLVIEGLAPPDRRLVDRFRLLVVPGQPNAAGGQRPLLLAELD